MGTWHGIASICFTRSVVSNPATHPFVFFSLLYPQTLSAEYLACFPDKQTSLLLTLPNNTMAQTPEQRKRNAKFTKEQNAKRGKPAQELKKKQEFKSPVSPVVLGVLGFVVFGGLIFELLSRFFLR